MPTRATQQFDTLHAMLAAGQRSLRIERHTLILWGLAGGILFLLSESILTPAQLPQVEERALAWLALLVAVLGPVGYVDWRMTGRAKQARDESWSFIHRQVLKVLWLLMAMGVLFTFACFFFGGGYMLCSVWLVAVGLGLYVHGLFSEELLEWTGALIILIGIISLALRLPFDTMRWITAAVFAIGLPLLAVMLDGGRPRPALVRLAQTTLWIVAVLALPLAAQRYANAAPNPEANLLTLEAFRAQREAAGTQVVSLPAGAAVPVLVELGGELFDTGARPVLPLRLAEPIEVLLVDGKLTGDIRHVGGPWQPARETRWIGIPWLKAELTPDGGPLIRAKLVVDFGGAGRP